jgi:hypothetical protein
MDAMMGVGTAANIAGGIMQSVAASQAAKAMARQFAKELNRQAGFSNEATAVFNPAVQAMGVERARQFLGTGEAERNSAYADVARIPLLTGYTAPLKDQAKLSMLGALRAKLGAYQDMSQQQNMGQMHAQQGINRIVDKAQGSAAVLPYLMDDAKHSSDELAFWGQLISSIGGQAMNTGALFGGPPQGQTNFYGNPGSVYTAPSGTSLSFDPTVRNMF